MRSQLPQITDADLALMKMRLVGELPPYPTAAGCHTSARIVVDKNELILLLNRIENAERAIR